MRRLLLVSLAFLAVTRAARSSADDRLNVHFVCHTHDDVGWLKTVDQYYIGSNSTIQRAGVQYILDSVVQHLLADPSRKFIYVEIAFFERWWNEQSNAVQDSVRQLVASGQLEFINGGYTMNDEGATYYADIIDQMTRGHSFLLNTFGVKPRIGWHIDPFNGHTSVQAELCAMMGFDGWFFGRIDYLDKEQRLADRTMENVWRGSPSLGTEAQIFSGVTYNIYEAPDDFRFEYSSRTAVPIQDDPALYDYNVDARAALLSQYVKEQASHYRTNNVMLTMGSDFQYMAADTWYKNLDKLIKYMSNNPQFADLNVFYSTPSMYLDHLYAANITWPLKTDDYMPYGMGPHTYQTGSFTSRAGLKRYIREQSSYLQSSRQIALAIGGSSDDALAGLTDALALVTHHDAVTGTEKQHVADDYRKRMSIGHDIAEASNNAALAQLLRTVGPCVQCPHLNESICEATQSLEVGQVLGVTMWNNLAAIRMEALRLPVANGTYSVTDGTGAAVPSQLIIDPVSGTPELTFVVHVSAIVGFNTFFVQRVGSSPAEDGEAESAAVFEPLDESDDPDDAVQISNGYYQLTFDSGSGHLTEILNQQTGQALPMDQALLWYNSSNGKDPNGWPSGAYILRPNRSEPFFMAPDDMPKLYVLSSGGGDDLVAAVRLVWNAYGSAIYRLYAGLPWVEVEYLIGPIDISDENGKEVFTRFSSPAIHTEQLYTLDSNGREMKTRQLNYRPSYNLTVTEPVACNYYPANTAAYIQDAAGAVRLTILTDRTQGGSSLNDGQLEVMLHRRMLYDDWEGVGEPLNETGADGRGLIIKTSHRVLMDSPERSAVAHRTFAQQIARPLIPFFWRASSVPAAQSAQQLNFSMFESALPSNLHLLSLYRFTNNTVLVRVEHLYEVNESSEYSVPVQLDVAAYFYRALNVSSHTEMTLTANQPLANVHPLQWRLDPSASQADGPSRENQAASSSSASQDIIVVNPMQIRTLLMQ